RWPLVLVLLVGCASTSRMVDVGSYRLWMDIKGENEPTVVFVAGGSANSFVWANITPRVRKAAEVRTIVYDRGGVGPSDARRGAYKIDDDVGELQRALDSLGVRGPIVLVAYGYAGFVATILAANDQRLGGVVLVDVFPVSFYTEAEVARLEARFTISFDAL